MSNQLIPVVTRPVGSETIQTVNARDLHEFLENKDRFATWIKDRIEQFDFVENQDFVSYSENSEKPRGGRPALEYALTLNMGKELSMVERNAKGKEARKYFLECERIAKDPLALLNDPATLKTLLLQNIEQQNELKHKVTERDKLIAVVSPKAAALDVIANTDGLICISTAAKICGKGPKEFFKWLYELKWIFKRPAGKNWLAHQDKLRSGYMEHKLYTYTNSDGQQQSESTAYLTPKGVTKLALLLGLNVAELEVLS
ncbi:MAG: phage antirepressor KilAC domain-containing protein [Desulfuromonadaceae bacterium]